MKVRKRAPYFRTVGVSIPILAALSILLFFQDRLSLGGIPLSSLWRIVFYLVILAGFVAQQRLTLPLWIFWLSMYLLYYPIGTGSGFSRQVLDTYLFTIPIMAGYLAIRLVESHTRHSGFFAIHILSIFLVLSATPFLIGLLDVPASSEFDQLAFAKKLGSNLSMFIGFFKHPNLAGKAIAFCSAVLLFAFFSSRNQAPLPRVLQVALIILSLYVLYRCFVRSSWLGIVVIFLFGVFRLKYSHKGIVLALIAAMGALSFLDIPLIYNRIFGAAGANVELTLSVVSSGRTDIWLSILQYQADFQPTSLIFGLGGLGYAEAFDDLYAHNLFIQTFAHSGIVGSTLLLLAILSLLRELRFSESEKEMLRFARSMAIAFVLFSFTSHGLDFWSGLIFGGVLYLATCRGQSRLS